MKKRKTRCGSWVPWPRARPLRKPPKTPGTGSPTSTLTPRTMRPPRTPAKRRLTLPRTMRERERRCSDFLLPKRVPGAIAAADAVLSDASASSELKQKASLKKSEGLSSEGKNAEALKELSMVMTHAEGEIAAAAMYQAGLVNLKLGETAAAEKLFGDFARTHASHENAPKALLQIAQIHLDAGDFASAAK